MEKSHCWFRPTIHADHVNARVQTPPTLRHACPPPSGPSTRRVAAWAPWSVNWMPPSSERTTNRPQSSGISCGEGHGGDCEESTHSHKCRTPSCIGVESPAYHPPHCREQREGNLSGVLQANAAFYKAFGDADLPAMEAVWGKSESVQVIHPAAGCIAGRDQVLSSWQLILEGGALDITIHNVRAAATDT